MGKQTEIELKKWCIEEAKNTMYERIIIVPIVNNRRMSSRKYYDIIMERAEEIYDWVGEE